MDQNGVILSYTVTYRALPSGSSQTKDVTAPANQTTLTGLHKYTNYNITVFASTSKGGGNQSTPIVVITDEDSKFVITELAYYFVCALYQYHSSLSNLDRQTDRQFILLNISKFRKKYNQNLMRKGQK